MRYVTAHQMQEIDRRTIKEFGIPSLILMENAGRGAFRVALEMLKDLPRPFHQERITKSKKGRGSNNKKVICVCGKGNNAGDGFVCARHLINNGIDVEIFLVGQPDELRQDAKINFSILRKMKAKIKILQTEQDFKSFKRKVKSARLIIDAIFGIGLSGEIKEPYSRVIKTMNDSGRPILAIDVPSGLDATTGNIHGTCIKAKKTVTFGLPKTGFIKNNGPLCIGELAVVDISIPKLLLK